MALSRSSAGGGLAGLGESWPEVVAARRAAARAAAKGQLPLPLGQNALETARGPLALGPGTPGGALVPTGPNWQIIENPGGNFQMGGVPNGRSLVPASPSGVAVPQSLAGQQAEQLALGPGMTAAAPTPPGAIPLGPATQAAQATAGAGSGVIPPVTPPPGGGAAAAGGGKPLGKLGTMLAYTPFNKTGGTGTMFGPGSLGRAGGYALAGTLASNAFDALVPEQDGAWDDAASNALQWAGAGAGVGSMFGPAGTAIGGIGAALLGGGYSLLTGGTDSMPTQIRKETEAQEKRFGALLSNAKLSPEAQIQIRTQLNAANYGAEDKATIKQNYQQVAAMLPAYAQQEEQQKRQLSYMLAMQNYLAPQFDSFLQNLGADKQAFQAANNELANQVGGANGAYIRSQGARGVLSDSATNAAYKAQLDNQVLGMAAQSNAPQSIVDSLTKMYG
jgi:hypothetical protein